MLLGQESERDQQPSVIPILNDEVNPQETIDLVHPLARKISRLRMLLLAIAAIPFTARGRNKRALMTEPFQP